MLKKQHIAAILLALVLLSSSPLMALAEEPVTLKMTFVCLGPLPRDLKLVEEEINKITLREINARVEITPLTMGNFIQQYNLMLSSGEEFDLMVPFLPFVFNSMVDKNYLLPLQDLLEEYGQGIKEVVDPVYLSGTTVNGNLYGITTIRDLGGGVGVFMRKDMVEAANIDLDSIKSLYDLTDVFAKVRALYPTTPLLVPFQIGVSPIETVVNLDMLGNWFGVLLDGGKELKVVNYFETEEYANLVKLMREWYLEGYILEDFATSQSSYKELIPADQGFAYFNGTKAGVEIDESMHAQREMVVVELSEPALHTNNIQHVTWCIPYTSKHPEKAMQMLNLMYTNADLMNLFVWGIEGKHYEVRPDGRIGYPEGISAENSGYNINLGWMFGNQFLTHVWETYPADYWDQMLEFNNSTIPSAALGFVFNQEPVKTEVAALESVLKEYRHALESGAVNPDTVLPRFLKALKDNGIDRVIEEKQKQLDAWAAANK